MKRDDYRLFHLFDGRVYGTTGDARPGDSGRVIPLYTVSCHKHLVDFVYLALFTSDVCEWISIKFWERLAAFVSKTIIGYRFGDKLMIWIHSWMQEFLTHTPVSTGVLYWHSLDGVMVKFQHVWTLRMHSSVIYVLLNEVYIWQSETLRIIFDWVLLFRGAFFGAWRGRTSYWTTSYISDAGRRMVVHRCEIARVSSSSPDAKTTCRNRRTATCNF